MPDRPILVISHERSGTHFLINTIALNFGLSEQVLNFPLGDPSAVAFDPSVPDPSLIRKSHHQGYWFGDRLAELVRTHRVFYVIRDCRGVLVSLFHYFAASRSVDAFPHLPSIPALLDACPADYPFDASYSMKPAPNFPHRWVAHIESWEPYFNDICVVTYEDLTLRLEQTVCRIATHLERHPVRSIARPPRSMYSVAPYRGVLNGWQDEMRQRDSARVWRMVRRHACWLTA